MKALISLVTYLCVLICTVLGVRWISNRVSSWWYARRYRKITASRKSARCSN